MPDSKAAWARGPIEGTIMGEESLEWITGSQSVSSPRSRGLPQPGQSRARGCSGNEPRERAGFARAVAVVTVVVAVEGGGGFEVAGLASCSTT